MAVNNAQPGSKPSLRDARIVSLLPGYVADIEDWISLGSVSRSIRSDLLEATTPHQHLQLAYASRRVFFRPNPGFLFVHLAKALSTWSSYSQTNLRRFIEAVWLGHEAVLELAVSIPQVALLAGWNQGKPRELWEWRMRVVNPLVDLLDKCVGEQWRAQEQFWDQPDAFTLEADPPAMLFQLITYGEMFGDAWRAAIWAAHEADKGRRGDTENQLAEAESTNVERKDLSPHVSLATRLECLKYLLPDWHLPRRPGDWRDMTSTRALRPDEYVYIRPTSDDADKRPQQSSGPDPAGVQPVMRSLTHPLRDVRTDIGPYEHHWTLYAAVDRPSGEAATWAVAQRASAEEHISAVRHLLQSSVHWLGLSRDVRGDLDSGLWPGSLTGVAAGSESDTGGVAGTAVHPEASMAVAELEQQDEDDEDDEGRPPESLHTRMSAAPWMFGLRGAEMLAAYVKYRDSRHTRDPHHAAADAGADQSLTDHTATASHLDIPVDISRVDASVVDTSHDFRQTLLRGLKVRTRDLGPVQVGRMTCYEIPDLLAEAIVLMQQ